MQHEANLIGLNMKKPTIYDVAEKAGVSATTVSIVLSEGQGKNISLSTKKRVLKAVDDIGYVKRKRSSPHCKDQYKSCTPSIALIVDKIDISDPFLNVFNALREVTDKYGYISEVYETGNNPNRLNRIIGNLNSRDTVGVIFATHRNRNIDEAMLSLIKAPLVLLNCFIEGDTLYPTVLPGDAAGAYDATTHLIRLGCRRIAHITGDMNDVASQERVNGYRRALITHDIAVDHRLIVHGGWGLNHGYESTKTLLALGDTLDAIVCGNDMSALGVYLAVSETSMKIGKEIAVIGYDNLPICETLSPSLTSMTMPYAEMMTFALEELFTQLTDRKKHIRVTKMESTLVERQSTSRKII